MPNFFNSPKIRLRVVSLAEGISLLVLVLIGVPMKHLYGDPSIVKTVGPIHGLLFVWYVLVVIQAKTEYQWPLGKTLLALLASFIPGGTFYADYAIFRHLRSS
jgi:integral membrane protein